MNIDKQTNHLGWETWHTKRSGYDCRVFKIDGQITWSVATRYGDVKQGTAGSLSDGIAQAVAWADKNKG
jgi:hypothetical protein